MAGYNLRLALVIQDTAQLLDVYGKESGHNILSNMGATLYFAPNDLDDARKLSELAGYTTERTRSHQYSNNASSHGGSSGRTLTVSEQRRALLLPQEMRALPNNKQLVVRAGLPVILCDKAPYYADPVLMKLFATVPCTTVVVNGETRSVPARPTPPPARWSEYERALTGSDCYLRRQPGGSGADIDERALLDAVEAFAARETDTEQAVLLQPLDQGRA
jgi:type IV secretion system protein VirD4